MFFSDSDVDNFRGYVGPNTEFEIRFGTSTNKIDRPTFDRFWNMGSTVEYSRDEFYHGNIRRTYITDVNGVVMSSSIIRKTKKHFIDNALYGFRVGFADEVPVNETITTKFETIRYKKRKSISLISGFCLDVTEVTHNGKVIYEIELEINGTFSAQILNGLVAKILKDLQDTLILYTIDTRYNVVEDFNTLNGSRWGGYRIDHTVLDQVRNLKIKDMVGGQLLPTTPTTALVGGQLLPTTPTTALVGGQLLPTTPTTALYGVDIKADGLKKFLYIHTTGIYLISAPNSVNKIVDNTGRITSLVGTVLQGELISKMHILFYDCLHLRGVSMRSKPFMERHAQIDQVLKVFVGFKFYKKTFRPFCTADEFYKHVNDLLNTKYEFKTDGLIIQPLNHHYDPSVDLVPLKNRILSKYPQTCKWKPPKDLSIDFEYRNGELYSNTEKGLVKFTGTSDHPLIYPINFGSLRDDIIYEFKYDYDKKALYMDRVRDDKPTPNNLEIAIDVWNDIHNPIDEETLRGKKWSLIFRYHNREKKKLYDMVVGAKTYLSIGTGRGGDILKIISAGGTHLYAVEPNQENRAELERRLSYFTDKLQATIIPNSGTDVDVIYKVLNGVQVDVLEYMLSLSFFFDSDQSLMSILQLAHYMVKPGGKLIIYTIDGRKVVEYFQNVNNRPIDGITFKLEGNRVFIDIPNTIVQNQTEYLVDIPRLTAALSSEWTLIHESSSTNEVFLTPSEAQFSSLFTGLIFQKLKQ